ncbi:MAG: hypothetical protein A2Y07_02705 [Planctomycetes bacterium GWF2_50_10]|nr:MAG: hypothetical protein A2Y07_02705 [Planctomycetes bacterium GWF2_50_10]
MNQNITHKFVNKCIKAILILTVISAFAGCSGKKAHMRFGGFFGSPTGVKFRDPHNLGEHHFRLSMKEKNGMVYTCKGGFIDIGHVREAADRTAYFKDVTFRNLMAHNTEFSFSVIEPSRYWVKVSYPANWGDISFQQRKKIADDTAIDLGQYFAHTSMIWHEILTWYGFATLKLFPDTISSFSWEDGYSDLLGTILAVDALRDNERTYDNAMTDLISRELEALDAQPANVGRQAAKMIKGKWYTGGLYFMVNMKKHNFDVGLDDGSISPMIVPGICPDAVPKLYPVPDSKLVEQYGFRVKLEIEPRVFEKKQICNSIDLDSNCRIVPNVHFPLIISNLKKTENSE